MRPLHLNVVSFRRSANNHFRTTLRDIFVSSDFKLVEFKSVKDRKLARQDGVDGGFDNRRQAREHDLYQPLWPLVSSFTAA
jgi:hypothetical protein